ncbi:MAG: hypothetical protein R6U96_05945 [Promethearchaeia archaeon]
MAIFINEYNIANHIWILAGFGFYAITGNTLNDIIDMQDPSEKETLERTEGYSRREIAMLAILSFLLGTASFMNPIRKTPILIVYLALTVILVVIYCKFKSLVFINHVLLGISHLFLPWFMIKINAGDIVLGFFPEMTTVGWLILACTASFAFTGEMVHELIDGDSISRYSEKTCQEIVWISALISLIIGIIALVMTQYYFFLPFIAFPVGIMFLFRRPRNLLGRTSLKDVGIIMGNMITAYLIILMIANF